MTHSGVAAIVAPFDENSIGFFVKDHKDGEVLEIETSSGKTYTIVIGDAEKGWIAIASPDRVELEGKFGWFSLQGSTAGGSTVKIGWIGVGLRLRLNSLTGPGLALLSATTSLKWLEGDAADVARRRAEETRPREATPEEEEKINGVYRKWLDERPWGDQADRVKAVLDQFSFPIGQVHIATILDTAREANKLEEGLAVIARHMEDHWTYRPPPMRGDIITEKDQYYLQLAYDEIGIKPPNQKS